MRWRVALGLALGFAVVAPAGAQAPVDPCHFYRSAPCPDLIMAPPDGLFVGRSPRGRLRLYAANHIVNVGAGPLEIKGVRSGKREMRARQVIHRRGLRPIVTPDAGELYFKFVDSRRGAYWKYSHAARFELWSLDATGNRAALVRTGPKLDYCFRDLDRVRAYARHTRRYPACSQVRGIETDRLGVSRGWADVYPSTYPENWIDITGLTGCFAVVHRVDPERHIFESNEANNVSSKIVRLPYKPGPQRCPRPAHAPA